MNLCNVMDFLSEDDEKQIHHRLDPIVEKWIKENYPNLVLPHMFMRVVYKLARECYLTGMLIDAQLAQIEIDKERDEKESKSSS